MHPIKKTASLSLIGQYTLGDIVSTRIYRKYEMTRGSGQDNMGKLLCLGGLPRRLEAQPPVHEMRTGPSFVLLIVSSVSFAGSQFPPSLKI